MKYKYILLTLFGLFMILILYFSFSRSQSVSPPLTSIAIPISKIYGVNMSGGEFGPSNLPGKMYVDYIYPENIQDYQYFKEKHFSIIRLPIRWERVQNQAFGSLGINDMTNIENILQIANKNKQKVIIDLHNFGRYYGIPMSASNSGELVDVWIKLATTLKSYPSLYGYELMNEPHDLPGGSDSWAKIAQAVTTAIRTVDTRSIIFIPGYNWQNAQNWSENNPHLMVSDPDNNIIYTSHIYFDSDYSGSYSKSFSQDNRNTNIGVEYSLDFRNWLAIHKVRGMFTEFGVPGNDPQWLTTLNNFLQSISTDQNIVGLVWWSAGPWWKNYPLSIEPINGKDVPQMQILTKYTMSR